jgi:carboxyl-terminal processing protease
LTTALYYTPSGRSIQAKGIDPDLRIPFEAPRDDANDMRDRFTLREKDLSGHLENGQKSAKHKKDEDAEKAKDMLARDNQIRMALELVKSLPRMKEIQ